MGWNKEQRQQHHEVLLLRHRKYNKENRQQININNKQRRDENPEKVKMFSQSRIRFKDSRISNHTEILRLGTCIICLKSILENTIEITHLHHFEYDDNNPTAHTIELCPSCHRKISTKGAELT